MSIKSDKWIRRMALEHRMIEPFEPHQIKEVRGRGLWIGIELNKPARPFCEALKQTGVLCKETHDVVIRIAPPLVITKAEIDWALERIAKVLT
jgi:ornithine--oxo-acid transaminase